MSNFGIQELAEDNRSVGLHANGRKCRKQKEGGWSRLALLLLVAVTLMATVEAQTFQYSRGWTNGKRSGGYTNTGPYDLDSGDAMMGADPLEVIIPPGHLQMSLNPPPRFRMGGDYAQYLVKRSATLEAARKQPMWIGTIVGMDGSVDGGVASSAPITTSNSNPGTASGSGTVRSNQQHRSGTSPSDF